MRRYNRISFLPRFFYILSTVNAVEGTVDNKKQQHGKYQRIKSDQCDIEDTS